MPVPLIAAGVASLIARAAVSTAAKKALTSAAARGLTKRQVAELVVRNEARAAKTLANKGIKTGPKRYEYKGSGYSDPKLDKAFRESPAEGSIEAMAKRMLAENPEKAAKIAAEKARVVMSRNRAQTVARVAKKKELTRTPVRLSERKPAAGPLTKKAAIKAERNRRTTTEIAKSPKARARVAERAEQRPLSTVDAAKVARRVRPPEGYSGASKIQKPTMRVNKSIDISVKVTKPATKRTAEEIKAARDAAKERSIARNAPKKITGKKSVTKPPVKSKTTALKERPRTQREMRRLRNAQEEMRKKDYKNKGRAERERDVDAEDVPQGITIRGKFYPEETVGIGARSTRGNKTIEARSPKVREDLPPKDELTAIRKAFAELTKEEKAAMRTADKRGIQGILREKIIKGPAKKPAGPKDAPIRKRLTPEERLVVLKRGVRARRAAETARNQRTIELKKRLTPAQRKAIALAIARAKRNSK
jgi:hypothetical protein